MHSWTLPHETIFGLCDHPLPFLGIYAALLPRYIVFLAAHLKEGTCLLIQKLSYSVHCVRSEQLIDGELQ